jgi:hypothetical protein
MTPTPAPFLSRRQLLRLAGLAVPAVALPVGSAFRAPESASAATLRPTGIGSAGIKQVASVTGRDFAQSNYCWYMPTVTSLKNVSYTIAPMSSTKAWMVPTQWTSGATNPLSLMRLGPNNSSSGKQVIVDGLTLTGTVQPRSGSNPTKSGHNYHGLTIYWGRNAQVLNSTFIAAAWGDYVSPPGETFALMGYRDTDTFISNVEVDGRTPDGTRVGGSPAGFNGSTRPVIADSYFHHSLVSSLTFSTAGGGVSASTATSSPTTRRLRIEHNANTKMDTGFRFTGINHEHVIGTITHYLPRIVMDWYEWNASHMFFGSWLTSAKIVITVNPSDIVGGAPYNNGALTLAVPAQFNGRANQQKLSDISVVDQTGKRLTAYSISRKPDRSLPISKTTHYVVNTA